METGAAAPKGTSNSLDLNPRLSTITITEELMDEDTKKKEKEIDLPIRSRISGTSRKELHEFIKQENEMISRDKKENERLDARNALEEYIFGMSRKLNADGNIRQDVLEDFQTTIDWLDSAEGYQETSVYVERLESLIANIY
ncbi:unnamed protein product [Rotaria magnacalcarata]|uniref:Uncharacterized protein n=2 Tax=Rotaria magnacalcarata TaxID=392030 RepID=A0A815AAM1_9BILA|nr:unnamed protein product [Rotaria magnacalcarata]CAF1638869.1 unnamed protein product [Rotaria magnacalcarata]CAF1948203.1 unnamed protein product [Rotaria magnacalcarata]